MRFWLAYHLPRTVCTRGLPFTAHEALQKNIPWRSRLWLDNISVARLWRKQFGTWHCLKDERSGISIPSHGKKWGWPRVCWEPSIQPHEIFTPKLCCEKDHSLAAAIKLSVTSRVVVFSTLMVMVAFQLLNDLAFTFWRGIYRFYEAQICGHLDFMLSELWVLHAWFVKLGISWDWRGTS